MKVFSSAAMRPSECRTMLREIFRIHPEIEERHDDALQVRRTGHRDFRVAANDDGVAVMAGVAPAPDRGLAHDHERGDLVERVVHPIGLEGGAVAGFMPAGIGGRGIEHAVEQIGEDGPPVAPERIGQKAAAEDEGKPENRVADGRPIAALQQAAHGFPRHRTLIPIGFGQALFHSQGGVDAGEAVVEGHRKGKGRYWCSSSLPIVQESRERTLPVVPITYTPLLTGRKALRQLQTMIYRPFFRHLHEGGQAATGRMRGHPWRDRNSDRPLPSAITTNPPCITQEP